MRSPLLFDVPREIQTPRLRLRAFQAGDGPSLREALVESRPALLEHLWFLPWVAQEPGLEMAELRARQAEANFVARTDLAWLMLDKVSGRLVGSVGLHRTDWELPKTEVGYWVRTSAAGQGYVSEGVRALTAWALNSLKAQRIELITLEANTASRRVAERCGFVLEGVHRHAQRSPDGVLHNRCVYAQYLVSPH